MCCLFYFGVFCSTCGFGSVNLVASVASVAFGCLAFGLLLVLVDFVAF